MDDAQSSGMIRVDRGSSPASRPSDGVLLTSSPLPEPTVSVLPPRWPLSQLPWTLSVRGSQRDARVGILLSSAVPCTGPSFQGVLTDMTPFR